MSDLKNELDVSSTEDVEHKSSSRRDALTKLGKYTAGGAALAFVSSRTNAQANCSSQGITSSIGNNGNPNGCN